MRTAHVPNPNGAKKQAPDRIVVHAMAEFLEVRGRAYHAADFLRQSRRLVGEPLSAHALVTPSGTVIRCRRDDQGAYHARGHNAGALGVEILVPGLLSLAEFVEAIDQTGWVPPWAYEAAVELVRAWSADWSIPASRIDRHCDVDPERKRDPGAGFPWCDFLADVSLCV